ncbi:MAG: preprotein translocase subunit SecY, partial [Gammaproteobacteria bacterium]
MAGPSAQQLASSLSGGSLRELRKRIFFVIIALVIFRVGSFIPVPGIDINVMREIFEQQRTGILGMFNMFSGGALSRMSIFALGVMPYISASIIMQLLTVAVPQLEQLKKEGESGRRKITQYTRYGTVALATFQSIGISIALSGQSGGGGEALVVNPGPSFIFTAAVTLVTGTMFLMWLGEQITERGVGNGISMLIFAGICAGLPAAIGGTFELVRTGELNSLVILGLFVGALAVTYFVVFIERGQRRITVN